MSFSTYCEEKDEDKVCIIMRGTPGSGKSYTVAQTLKSHSISDRMKHVFSTDDFWTLNYASDPADDDTADKAKRLAHYKSQWNFAALGRAHKWNFERFKQAVDSGVTPIIVDNVNSTRKDMKEYAEYAFVYGYKIVVQEPTSPWWQEHAPFLRDKDNNKDKLAQFAKMLAGRNEHGVPEETIAKMLTRWAPDIKPEDLIS